MNATTAEAQFSATATCSQQEALNSNRDNLERARLSVKSDTTNFQAN